MKNKKNNCKPFLFENSEITVIMNPIKLFLALAATFCASMLYAEDNIYIKQQVAYKDQFPVCG
jgi:hypothetical protein